MKLETLAPAGELLDLAADAPFAVIGELAGTGDVVVLAPHPDDESLGCGTAIARAHDAGRQVHVVVMTDGSASHPASRKYPPARIAALRKAEVTEALDILTGGNPPLTWLGVPDTALPSSGPGFDKIVDLLAGLIAEWDVTGLWSSWGGDPHCDHRATAAIARAATSRFGHIRHWSYPVWGRFAAIEAGHHPGSVEIRRLEPLPDDRKRQAIEAHVSQMSRLIDDDPDGFMMPAVMRDHFAKEPEIFLREKSG